MMAYLFIFLKLLFTPIQTISLYNSPYLLLTNLILVSFAHIFEESIHHLYKNLFIDTEAY